MASAGSHQREHKENQEYCRKTKGSVRPQSQTEQANIGGNWTLLESSRAQCSYSQAPLENLTKTLAAVAAAQHQETRSLVQETRSLCSRLPS